MVKIESRGQTLFLIKFPVAVSVCHVPKEIPNPENTAYHQWWQEAEEEETTTEILELRVWARTKVEALQLLTRKIHMLSAKVTEI